MNNDINNIMQELQKINAHNLCSKDVQFLAQNQFDSSLQPLVSTINDTIRNTQKLQNRVREESSHDIEETLQGAKTGIWAIELEDGFAPRMFADKTMRGLLNIDNEDLTPEQVYNAWYDYIDPAYLNMVKEVLSDMTQGKRAEVVYPWGSPKHEQIYVRCGGVRDSFNKPGIRFKGYHQDITDTMVTRKKQEKAVLEAMLEAKKANIAKTEFISNMSHDIRTPINGILGMLLIGDKNKENLQKQAECRNKIRMSAEHLLSLINDVLDISKIESGAIDLQEEIFNIHELIDNSIGIVGSQAEESGIMIQRSHENILHPYLVGSPLHLRQILINVIGNGIKYNKRGGLVLINTKEIDYKDGLSTFKFEIADNGQGMSEDFQRHLFEPFTQELKDARTSYKGTGLGMAITKGLLDQMHGTISVDSLLGSGTKITIEMPIKVGQKPPHIEGEKPLEDKDITGMKILLAEDNDLNREIAEYMLKDAGAVVINATNGKEALDIYRKNSENIDCILMDIMMPIMDGLEATVAIRQSALKGCDTVPIIALSANAFKEDEQKAKNVGINSYLTKPLDVDKMLYSIASYKNHC